MMHSEKNTAHNAMGNENPNRKRPEDRDLLRKRRSQVPPPPNKQGGKFGWSLGHRFAFIILLFLLGILLWKQMNSEQANYKKVNYSTFTTLVESGNVAKVNIRNSTLIAELVDSMKLGKQGDERMYPGIIVTVGAYDQNFIKDLDNRGIDVTIEPERTWMNILIQSLPWILIFGIWLFIIRQMQGGPKGVFTFGKSKAKLIQENTQKITFKDVAGVEEAKVELQEIIDFLKDPGKFQRLGGKIPKGALLVGPPGTGKTLLARAVAGEAGVPFFSMSGSDFVEMFVGVGASRVRDLFEQGKSNAPCIIFIDEIDAVGRQRGAGIGGGHDEREQTLNQLLVEMDGFESNEGVILLAATNRPDVLDPALLRPGRFDRQIVVDWPDVKAREKILEVHARQIKVDNNIRLDEIAKGTPGMTGADLANVVNEAALLAARLNHKHVIMADFEEAKDKVMMGTARKTLVITEEEKKLTAYHEAGHVLASKFVPGSDPVHKVSIIARGRALGLTHFLPVDERHNWSFTYLMGKLTVLLGGRAAEIVKFNDVTNGAANDIERATAMARKMVCEWGMSKRLGPLAFGKKEQEVFLGREIATHKDYSEETAVAIDEEVRKFIETAQQQAETIILENNDKLEKLTAELLKREVLDGEEIDRLLNGRPKRSRRRSSTRRKRSTSSSRSSDSAGDKSSEKPVRAENLQKTETSSPTAPGQKTDSHPQEKNTSMSKDESNKDDKKKSDNSGGGKRKRPTKSKKKSDGDDKKKRDKERRTRIIRMKTGGRRRVIRKAPAQKIREIK